MIPTVDVLISAEETDVTILAAVDALIEMASEAAQRLIIGKNSFTQDEQGEKIVRLLTAWRQKDNLTGKEQEAILDRLDNLTKTAA